MKYFYAITLLVLLLVSRRFREKRKRSLERLAEENDAIEASVRRLDAQENGGKPRMRLL